MLLDVLVKTVIVVNGMAVDRAIDMHMREHVAVLGGGVVMVEVSVAGFTRRGLRGCDQRPLQGERHRGCHHDDGSETPQEWLHAEAQRCSSSRHVRPSYRSLPVYTTTYPHIPPSQSKPPHGWRPDSELASQLNRSL
jgi:hypothetical protein